MPDRPLPKSHIAAPALAPLVLSAILLALMAACPEPISPAFVERIRQDVAAAVAPTRAVTVASDGNGVVSPVGTTEVKEGIPTELSATPFSSHVFGRWTQSGGTGTALFAEPSSATTTVSVSGGDVELLAEFEARPKVTGVNPSWGGIFINSKVIVYFSKAMDPESLTAPGAISILKNGLTPVAGTVEIINSTTARFVPDAYLVPQALHTVQVSQSVRDAMGITMEAGYTDSFKTASTADTIAPLNPTFDINAVNPSHVGTLSISLTGVTATEDGELVEVRILESGVETVLPYTETIAYTLQPGDGAKTLSLRVADSVDNLSEAVQRSVILDTTPPVGSFAINNAANAAADYVNVTDVRLASAVTDSGTAMTGAEMRWSFDGGATWSVWTAWSATKAATLGSGDGAKSIALEVRDIVGNTLSLSDSIVLDTQPPVIGSFLIDGGAQYTNQTYSSAGNSASDGTAGLSDMRISYDDGSTWEAWESYATTKSLYGWELDGSWTLRLEVRDRAGNSASLSDGIFVDRALPLVSSLAIDANASYALSQNVSLTQSASDPGSGTTGSGLSQMRFSNDGSVWSGWEAWSTGKAWALSAGDGSKSVTIQVRDAAGNLSSVAGASDGIVLDTAAPVVSSFTITGTGDGSNAYTNTVNVTLASSVSDAAGSPLEMRFSNDNSTWTGWTAYSAVAPHALAAGNGSKTVYYQFRDVLGTFHHETALGQFDAITLDSLPPTVALDAPANSSTVAGDVPCSATASDDAGIWKVEFFGNGVSLGADTTAPYEAPQAWSVHALTESGSFGAWAVAYDRAGNSTNSTQSMVTIDNWSVTKVTPSAVGTYTGARSCIASNEIFTRLFIAYENMTTNTVGLISSNDGGSSWTAKAPVSSPNGMRPALAVDRAGFLHAAYIYNNSVYYRKSQDYEGTNWSSPLSPFPADASPSFTPCIEVSDNNTIHVLYVSTSSQIKHYYASWGTDWNQASTITGSSVTWLDSALSGTGLHIVYRESGTNLIRYSKRDPGTASTIIPSTTIATGVSTGGVSVAATTSVNQYVLVSFLGAGDVLQGRHSANGGSTWSPVTMMSGYPSAFPAASAALDLVGSNEMYACALNNYNANSLTIAKSPDASVWYAYDIDSTNKSTIVSAICDGEYLYISYYDSSVSRLKFAKARFNF